jgi:hypothetical protein
LLGRKLYKEQINTEFKRREEKGKTAFLREEKLVIIERTLRGTLVVEECKVEHEKRCGHPWRKLVSKIRKMKVAVILKASAGDRGSYAGWRGLKLAGQ